MKKTKILKVLLLGDKEGAFIKAFSEKLVNQNFEVHIFDPGRLVFLDVSHNKSIQFKPNRRIYARIPKLRHISECVLLKRILKQFHNVYDICQIHYNREIYSEIWQAVRSIAPKLIVSVYGSDFYRRDAKARRLQRRIYRTSDYITFTSESTRNEFIDFYGKEWMDKIRVLNFGCSGLDSLDDLKSENKKESKQRLGIPVNSLVIACGYSSDPRQNHMEMINSILKVRDVLPQDVFLVFPMTYGAQEYSLQIESYLKKTTLHYKIFNQFLDAYDIARIRKVSDIMINIQDTDQLSCSMLEHMYAGGVIITGGWLPYDILTAKGAFLTTINSIRDVGAELLTIIHKIDDLQKLSIPNKSIVDQMERWDRNIKSWAEFFAGLKKKKI